MAAYIVLASFTDQGVRNAKQTVERARAFKKQLESAGSRLIAVWWTMGQYDLVLVVEGPDDATITRQLLALGTLGNVRTASLRAFSEDEMEKIVQGMR